HVDVAAEQRRHALAAARERDECPARAAVLLQQLPHDVVAAGDRAARLLELAGVLSGRSDEIGERLVGRIRLHRDHRRLEHQAHDRSEILEGNPGFRAGQRTGQPDAGEETDRVRVTFFLGEVGSGHRGTAPGLVDYLHAHRQELLLSTIRATARASRSLPPPGPVCTTTSTGLAGLKPWANAVSANELANAMIAITFTNRARAGAMR